MSLLDSVTNFFTGNTGPLISAAGSMLGGLMGNQARADQAQKANEFSAQQFATRYQTTVKDMQAAGLNPMLAYSQGGGSPPSGQQASQEDVISPAVNSFNTTRSTNIQQQLANAQVNNITADTALKSSSATLMEAQARQAHATAFQQETQAGVNAKMVNQIDATIEKTLAETKNVDLQSANIEVQREVLYRTILQIEQETSLLDKKWYSEEYQQQYYKSLAAKVVNETKLSGLDLKAAESLDNIGRESQQFKVLLDAIKMFLRK